MVIQKGSIDIFLKEMVAWEISFSIKETQNFNEWI